MSEPNKITELYACIAEDADGNEGIPATPAMLDGDPYFMLLIGADAERVTLSGASQR